MLITSSNFVGCSTGSSPGLAPLRIFATCPAARRSTSEVLGPYDMRARLRADVSVQTSIGSRLFVASSTIWLPCVTRNELGTRTTALISSQDTLMDDGCEQ